MKGKISDMYAKIQMAFCMLFGTVLLIFRTVREKPLCAGYCKPVFCYFFFFPEERPRVSCQLVPRAKL